MLKPLHFVERLCVNDVGDVEPFYLPQGSLMWWSRVEKTLPSPMSEKLRISSLWGLLGCGAIGTWMGDIQFRRRSVGHHEMSECEPAIKFIIAVIHEPVEPGRECKVKSWLERRS
jgi:hypothetical protein